MSERSRFVFPAAAAIYLAHAFLANRVVDDCYITFRYVRNWVAGDGPVFNPGERVEGYTNFLWTALLALVHRVAPGLGLLQVAQALALACGVGLLWLVARSGRALRFAWFAPLLLALDAPFIVWSTGGLETTLFALLVFWAAVAELDAAASGRGLWKAPLLLALATMTRPDGIVFVAALASFRAWRCERAPGRLVATDARALRHALLGLLVFGLIYGPYWFWRWRYYGWPVPNTFYAKVGGGLAQWKRGASYVLDWIWPGALALALLPFLPLARRLAEARVRLFALFVAAGLFYVVAVGGESLGLFRFMVPLLPFVALLAQEGLGDLAEFVGLDASAARRRSACVVVGAIVAGTFAFAARPTLAPLVWPSALGWDETQSGLRFPGDGVAHSYRWFDNYFVDRLAVAARWIDGHGPPDALVAATPAGSIGYHMRQPLIDMLGLNDATIAHESVADMGTGRAGHEKGDGHYILSRKPRFILLDNVAVFDHALSDAEVEQKLKLRSEHEIWADPAFHRDYEKKCVAIGDAELTGIAPVNRRLFRFFTFYERRP